VAIDVVNGNKVESQMKKQRPVSNAREEEEIDFLQIVRGLALFCAALSGASSAEKADTTLARASKFENYILRGTVASGLDTVDDEDDEDDEDND
jgi:hypothetical protein